MNDWLFIEEARSGLKLLIRLGAQWLEVCKKAKHTQTDTHWGWLSPAVRMDQDWCCVYSHCVCTAPSILSTCLQVQACAAAADSQIRERAEGGGGSVSLQAAQHQQHSPPKLSHVFSLSPLSSLRTAPCLSVHPLLGFQGGDSPPPPFFLGDCLSKGEKLC